MLVIRIRWARAPYFDTDGAIRLPPGVGNFRGGNIPKRAVDNIVPGLTFLNSNKEPNRTCWITGNFPNNCKKKFNFF